MQLITILLATVSVLTLLSGTIVFFGSSKGHRVRSFWFFFAAIAATIWMASISLFMIADPSWSTGVDCYVEWTFTSAILIDVAFLGYITWLEKHGKPLTLLFLVFGLIISALISLKPDLFYNDIILSNTGNSVSLKISPLFISYVAFFAAIVPVIVMALLKKFARARTDSKKSGNITVMTSFGLSSAIVFITNLVLPLLGNWDVIWLGPLSLAITIIAFYYTILRYRSLNLSSIWLKIFSYVVIIASIAIVYMVIFSVIFAGLFRGSTPSTEVIMLNFIMILIFLLLMPAINQLIDSARSLIDDPQPKSKKAKGNNGAK